MVARGGGNRDHRGGVDKVFRRRPDLGSTTLAFPVTLRTGWRFQLEHDSPLHSQVRSFSRLWSTGTGMVARLVVEPASLPVSLRCRVGARGNSACGKLGRMAPDLPAQPHRF